MAKTRLFVYGLLMRGLKYHESYLSGLYGAVERASAKGRLVYLSEAACPALTAGEETVWGELFEVEESALTRIDYLQGYKEGQPEASEYMRRLVDVARSDGSTTQAWTYMMRAETLRRRFPLAPLIEGGDFRAYLGTLSRLN